MLRGCCSLGSYQQWNIPLLFDLSSLCPLLKVKRTYSQGTYRAGAMRQISLVGAVDEEVGDYFPEFLGMLAESPFLEVSVCVFCLCVARRLSNSVILKCLNVVMQRTLPWGTFSSLRLQSPTESDDGPIMWVRPGEQMIPMADMPKSPFKRKRWVPVLNLQWFIQEFNNIYGGGNHLSNSL